MKRYLLRALLCVVLLASCCLAQAANAQPPAAQPPAAQPGLKISKGITALVTADGKIQISPLVTNAPNPAPLPEDAIRFTCQGFEFDLAADGNGKPMAAMRCTGQVTAQLGAYEVRADSLTFMFMLKDSDKQHSPQNVKLEDIKFQAVGNIQIKGPNFTAYAARISFHQAGDLILLEGSSQKPAAIHHRQKADGPTSKLLASRITYRPRDGKIKIDNAQSIELNLDRRGK